MNPNIHMLHTQKLNKKRSVFHIFNRSKYTRKALKLRFLINLK